MARQLQSRTWELVPGDVVVGRGRVTAITDVGWAGWRFVHFADGTRSDSVTLNQVWDLV